MMAMTVVIIAIAIAIMLQRIVVSAAFSGPKL